MTRLIDVDALLINLDGMMAVSHTGYIHGDTVADMISDAPTVEAVPVVHGKWELLKCWTGFETLYCSECNYETTLASNYCPFCGADMRGEKDG